MTIIDQMLHQYLDAIDSGFGLIGGDVRGLFNTLLTLNMVIAALFWALSDDQVLVPLIRKALYVGVFAWIIENWAELTQVLASTFVLLGLKAGGSRITLDFLMYPGTIAERGITIAKPIMQAMRDLSGPIASFENLPEILLLGAAMVAIIVSFFFVAVQMVMAFLTFKLGTLVSFVLLPFSMFTHTSFIAERPLGWVVSSGVRFMLLALVVSLGETIFAKLNVNAEQLTFDVALDIALGALAQLVLALTASRLATDLATGTPRLGALDAGIALSGTALAATYAVKHTYSLIRSVVKGAKVVASKAAAALHRGEKSPSPADSQASQAASALPPETKQP